MRGLLARAALIGLVLLLGSCSLFQPPPPPLQAHVHYVLERPYQIGSIWYYPRAEYGVDITGLATIAADHAGLTADGEIFDQSVLAAGNRTLQLPAIARVTNLENGRQITLRINDRGPTAPARILAVTRRAADLLEMHEGSRIRLQMLDTETRQLSVELQSDGAALPLDKAPVKAIESEQLAPPSGVAQAQRVRTATVVPAPVTAAAVVATSVPLRLPEQVFLVSPKPGRLYIAAGDFSRQDYAFILVNRLSFLGARLTTSYDAPRDRAFQIRIGPFDTVAEAEAVLARTISAGVNDASIVVE